MAKKHEEFLASDWNSPHAEWVVDCYYHAVVSPFPKKRYVVGNEANYMYVFNIHTIINLMNTYIVAGPSKLFPSLNF